jgi:hypothetical protein
MKKYMIVVFLFITIAGCKKDYLDKLPTTTLTEETALITSENFKTYTWGLYDYFEGYGDGSGADYPPYFRSQELNSDNISQTLAGNASPYAIQTKTLPQAGARTSALLIARWDFSYVRQVNVMLDKIDGSTMTQVDKDHWRSIGYFFRALRYYDLIAAFGDVPWVEHALSDTSASELFAVRTPRDQVAKNMLDNLIWAESHIKPSTGTGVEKNTINEHVIRALISRFGLFEGAWRKYHALADADTYLQACKTYSEKLLASFPTIMSSYDDVTNSDDLSGKAGIILFRQYAPNLRDHANPRFAGSTSWYADMTKDAVESYLCTDGRPISTSSVYAGDKTMYNTFRNRDRRLYFCVVPPYKVNTAGPTFTLTGNLADVEYINLMNSLPGNLNKKLPNLAQSPTWTTGNVISTSPHFRNFNAGQPQAVGELGYYFWKFTNRLPFDNSNNSANDCPLFKIEEVMLNYAEAMFELGQFNQSIATNTINKLRVRAGVANMDLSVINASFDLNRDAAVDPVLWEIRRERRIELMGDGFRFNDLKRWNKGTYLNKQQLGIWAKNADYGNKLLINGGAAEGYVKFYDVPQGWLDKYYLEPIPPQEIVLNPQLKQTNGW